MWAEYIEQRKKQRLKEEEDLRKLKERQAKRKAQRAEQEKMMLEMKRKQEEQKQREIVSLKSSIRRVINSDSGGNCRRTRGTARRRPRGNDWRKPNASDKR